MTMSNSAKQIHGSQSTRDLKTRVLTALHRLSDRDTQSSAASELDTIAATLLTPSTIPIFISSAITSTHSSDTSAARRHCIRLISVLSRHHPPHLLSPHLHKLVSAVLRRLRDQDSSVRSTAASAVADLASSGHHPFNSLTKPFFETLFTDPDPNAQSGAALCLVRIIEEVERHKTGISSADVAGLRRVLVKLERLVKNDGFKGKAAALGVVGSVVGIEGVLASGVITKNLVGCLMGFFGSEEWAVRKATAEALWRMAAFGVAEDKSMLSEFKASCLKTFEAKKFDKVKIVRETMNQLILAWKEIPDLSGEISNAPSSKEDKTSVASNAPQLKNTRMHLSHASPLSTARNKSPLSVNEKKKEPAMFRKLDRKKPTNLKPEIAAPNHTPVTVISKNDPLDDDDDEERIVKPEIRRTLFNDNDQIRKQSIGCHVVPCGEASVVVSNDTGDLYKGQRECEDLSLIRKQLVQIENQQSTLLDILQKFIGSSQNGMHSLETRVHGLELALDEISFDLAIATGKLSRNSSAWCSFLSPKLWRKQEASSRSTVTSSFGTPSTTSTVQTIRNRDAERFLQNRRYNFRGGRGIIKNPLAEIPRGTYQETSQVSSSRLCK